MEVQSCVTYLAKYAYISQNSFSIARVIVTKTQPKTLLIFLGLCQHFYQRQWIYAQKVSVVLFELGVLDSCAMQYQNEQDAEVFYEVRSGDRHGWMNRQTM
jgi:hypothetical protein